MEPRNPVVQWMAGKFIRFFLTNHPGHVWFPERGNGGRFAVRYKQFKEK